MIDDEKENDDEDFAQLVFEKMTLDVIKKHQGANMIKKHYSNSPLLFLASNLPQISSWTPWKWSKNGFSFLPHDFWQNKAHARLYCIWLTTQINKKLSKNTSTTSPTTTPPSLSLSSPPPNWLSSPSSSPLSPSSSFSDSLLSFAEIWYKHVKRDDFLNNGGAALLRQYGQSISLMLEDVFPEIDWQPWRLRTTPIGYWRNPINVRRFARWLQANELSSIHEKSRDSNLSEKQERIEDQEEIKQRKSNDEHGGEEELLDVEKWYTLDRKTLEKVGALGVLSPFSGSIPDFVSSLFPKLLHSSSSSPTISTNLNSKENDGQFWMPWRFKSSNQKSLWEDTKQPQRYLLWLAKKLSLKQKQDFYRLTGEHFNENHGSGLLKRYKGSVYHLVSDLMPEHDWLPWLFKTTPAGFWYEKINKKKKKKKQMKMAKKNGQTEEEDQSSLNVKQDEVESNSDQDHIAFLDDETPVRLNIENWRRYASWLGNHLGYENQTSESEGEEKQQASLSYWYQLTAKDLQQNGGTIPLSLCKSSPSLFVAKIFPASNWKPWLFKNTPKRFWEDKTNQRSYMNWLKSILNITQTPQDWYKITIEDFQQNKGSTLLSLYNNSPIAILKNVVDPDYDWKPWLFSTTPMGFWNARENRRAFGDWLGVQLGFESADDWYSVRTEDFVRFGGRGALDVFRGSARAFVMDCVVVFEDEERTSVHQWNPLRFSSFSASSASLSSQTFSDFRRGGEGVVGDDGDGFVKQVVKFVEAENEDLVFPDAWKRLSRFGRAHSSFFHRSFSIRI